MKIVVIGGRGLIGSKVVSGLNAQALIVTANVVTINIFDEANKPVATKGFTASALIVSGAERETITLTPQDENALKGEAKKPVAKGATISVTLKTAAAKTGQARFKP